MSSLNHGKTHLQRLDCRLYHLSDHALLGAWPLPTFGMGQGRVRVLIENPVWGEGLGFSLGSPLQRGVYISCVGTD